MDEDDVLVLDSDSDFESSPPKNRRTATTSRRSRRKVNRGRKTQSLVPENTTSNTENVCNTDLPDILLCDHIPASDERNPICIDIDTNSTNTVLPPDSSSENRNVVIVDSALASEVKSSNPDVAVVNTVPTQQRKKGRRGLARSNNSDLTADGVVAEGKSLTSRASVYSKCVSQGFHSIYNRQLPQKDTTISDDKALELKENACSTDQTDVQLTTDHTLTSNDENKSKIHSRQDNESTDDETDGSDPPVTSDSLRSPTPPPELGNTKRRSVSRRVKKALSTLTTAKANLDKETFITVTTPSSRTRRGHKKGQQQQPQDPQLIVDSPVVKADMIVKVRYLSTVYRLNHNKTDPFYVLLRKISHEVGKEEHELGLFLRDSSLEISSSPSDVNLTVADIIECYCMKDTSGNVLKGDEVNVVIQCSNSRRKTSMVAYQRLPLRDLMERYAAKLELDIDTFVFSFDGDYVNPSDTLLKLDIEDGDVLDVIPKKVGQKFPPSYSSNVISLI